MTTSAVKSPVTRETSAYVRERGFRPLIATLTGGVLVLRAKGLRSEETVDLGAAFYRAVKERVARERAEKRKAKGKK